MGSSRVRGFSVTPEKLALIEQKMHKLGIESRKALAEAANLRFEYRDLSLQFQVVQYLF